MLEAEIVEQVNSPFDQGPMDQKVLGTLDGFNALGAKEFFAFAQPGEFSGSRRIIWRVRALTAYTPPMIRAAANRRPTTRGFARPVRRVSVVPARSGYPQPIGRAAEPRFPP